MRKALGFAALLALAFVFTSSVYAEEHEGREKRNGNSWTGVFENKDGKCYLKSGDNEVVTAAGENATADAKTKLGAYADQLVGKGNFVVTGEMKETDGKKWIAVATIKKARGDGEHGDRDRK
jgi:hypothetical protein